MKTICAERTRRYPQGTGRETQASRQTEKCQREQEETQEYENERQVMYMDLTDMISGGTEEQPIPEQKLTKEEYAAKNSRKEKRYGLK